MTRIAVNFDPFIVDDDGWDIETQELLEQRLAATPMVIFGSRDVQINTYGLESVIGQYVMLDNGSFDEVQPTTVSLELLHVHKEATQADNDLAAKTALAVIWLTLPRELVVNPNVLVLQNGSTSYGWAEGGYDDLPVDGIVACLDDFIRGSRTREDVLGNIRTLLVEKT